MFLFPLQCSVTCGKGIKQRIVRCRGASGIPLRSAECNAATRPWTQTICYQPSCETRAIVVRESQTFVHSPPPPADPETASPPSNRWISWRTGGWTGCSVTCGIGVRARYVSCRDRDGRIAEDSACAHLERPPSRETCTMRACGMWRLGDWTEVRRNKTLSIWLFQVWKCNSKSVPTAMSFLFVVFVYSSALWLVGKALRPDTLPVSPWKTLKSRLPAMHCVKWVWGHPVSSFVTGRSASHPVSLISAASQQTGFSAPVTGG